MAKLVAQNLTYTYDSHLTTSQSAIHDVTLSVEEGQFVGLIGHTGSGKSTLVQHLNGLLKPTSGTVYLDGQDIWAKPKEMRKVRTKVGLVFQYPEYQLFEETVYRDIAFAAKNAGFSEKETESLVKSAAAFTGVEEELFDQSPFELSGGQKRRVAIAGVMAMRPDVLVLDEPTAGLDPKGRDEILGRIKNYQREEKKTVILVSHSMEDVAKYADMVAVMNHGSLAMYDTTEAIFSQTEELRRNHLEIPQITQIFDCLRERGIAVEKSVFTVPYAINLLKKRRESGKRA